ncbi:MAG: HAD family acid phosphatase [Acidobacteriota bacterium]|nr:HAD family acid phosphatase [Acidobacteriota bacterium]
MASAKSLVPAALLLTAAACGPAPPPTPSHPALDAVSWTQLSAEREALVRGIYTSATRALDVALGEHRPAGDARPPAVVLDVDETVLDNAPFEAALLKSGAPFDPALWNRWVDAARAEPLPGAIGFLAHCRDAGVATFFITNRRADQEEATRRNLERLGIPVLDEPDGLLMREEKPEWGRDKASRRAQVARTHHIVLLIGDDLGDFLPNVTDAGVDTARRRERVAEHAQLWGHRWFVLPNPLYGSWKGALWGFARGLSEEERRRAQFDALHGDTGAPPAE